MCAILLPSVVVISARAVLFRGNIRFGWVSAAVSSLLFGRLRQREAEAFYHRSPRRAAALRVSSPPLAPTQAPALRPPAPHPPILPRPFSASSLRTRRGATRRLTPWPWARAVQRRTRRPWRRRRIPRPPARPGRRRTRPSSAASSHARCRWRTAVARHGPGPEGIHGGWGARGWGWGSQVGSACRGKESSGPRPANRSQGDENHQEPEKCTSREKRSQSLESVSNRSSRTHASPPTYATCGLKWPQYSRLKPRRSTWSSSQPRLTTRSHARAAKAGNGISPRGSPPLRRQCQSLTSRSQGLRTTATCNRSVTSTEKHGVRAMC